MVNHLQPSNEEIRKYGDSPQSTDFFLWISLFRCKKNMPIRKKSMFFIKNIKKSLFYSRITHSLLLYIHETKEKHYRTGHQ